MSFSWILIYKEIALKLLEFEDNQLGLIEVLNSLASKNISTISMKGLEQNLKEIDPFTFFANFNRGITESNRIKFLTELKQLWKLNSSIPTDFDGIPVVNNLTARFFQYDNERRKTEIQLLWKIFNEALKQDFVFEETFNKVLERSWIGVRMTIGLFWVSPEKYMPLDKKSSKILKFDYEKLNWNTYKQIMESIKVLNKFPYQLSYDAHLNWEKSKNYWIFQGNPKIFRVEEYLNENDSVTWTTSSNFKRMQEGDIVLFWVSGQQAKIVAKGVISKAPSEDVKDNVVDSKYWISPENEKGFLKCEIDISERFEKAITRDAIKEILPELPIIKFANATNFNISEEDYDIIMSLASDDYSVDTDFKSSLSKYKESERKVYFSFLQEIIEKNNLHIGDKRIVFSLRENRINFIVGQRYCWNLYLNEARGNLGVISKSQLISSGFQFDGNGNQPFYNYFNEQEFNSIDKSSIHAAISEELARSKQSGFIKYNHKDLEEYVFGEIFRIERGENVTLLREDILPSKNIILYGCPGVGKTYSVLKEYVPLFTDKNIPITEDEHLKTVANKYAWWQIIAAVLFEIRQGTATEIMNHKLLKAKNSVSSSNNQRATVWGMLQQHTKPECENVKYSKRSFPYLFEKDKESIWTVDKTAVEKDSPEILQLLKESSTIPPSAIENKRYEFVTFHQSFSYEDFVEGIKPETDEESESDIQYRIHSGIFKNLAKKAFDNPTQDYALFIDEINRGSVSRIFGELITLIEDDKRLGSGNAICTRLPYSKEEFGVPSNLYIIGTMNTADRSVETLDTALRRRFTFREILPNATLLKDKIIEGVNLQELLVTLNHRIGVLYDREHKIGHSFFLKVQSFADLKSVFKNSIIPLLEEYFYSDWGKLRLILGNDFVKKVDVSKIRFMDGNDYEYLDELKEKKVYRLLTEEEYSEIKPESFISIYNS